VFILGKFIIGAQLFLHRSIRLSNIDEVNARLI